MLSFTGSCFEACLFSAKDLLIFFRGQLSCNTRQRTCFLNSNKCCCKLGYFSTNFPKSKTCRTILIIRYHTSMYGSAFVKKSLFSMCVFHACSESQNWFAFKLLTVKLCFYHPSNPSKIHVIIQVIGIG